MTAQAQIWSQSLDPQKVAEIRRLHRLNPSWNFTAGLFVLAWGATGFLVMSYPYWYIRGPGYLFIGLLLSGMANLMHEAAHGNVFRKRRRDRWFGVAMGLPVLVSLTAYRVSHLLHHRYNRTEKDPDEFVNITSNKRLLSVLYYVWLLVGTFIYIVYVPFVALTQSRPTIRRAILVEYAIMVATGGALLMAAVRFGFLDVVVHCWVIPLLLDAVWINLRYWSEHTLTIPGHPLTETRTVVSNPVFSFLNVNMNYHLEHHLYPGVPWYNLPKVHRLLRDEYKAAGSSIYRSYLLFLVDAFRVGIHGRAMRR